MRLAPSSAVVLCVSGFLALTTDAVESGPDETTSRLMNEYVSLMDFGLLRLQMKLDATQTIAPSYVSFNWESNTITIRKYLMDRSFSREQVEESCVNWLRMIREEGGVNTKTGKIFEVLPMSFFSVLFTHEGYSNTVGEKSTEEAASELDSKIQLECHWNSFSKMAGEVESIAYTGPLLDTGHSVKVIEVK